MSRRSRKITMRRSDLGRNRSKGLISLDAMIAITALLFLVLWFQSFGVSMLENSSIVGTKMQSKTLSLTIGSQLNAFMAIKPQSGDYACVTKPALKVFPDKDVTNYAVAKTGAKIAVGFPQGTFPENLKADVLNILYNMQQSYPVIGNVIYFNGAAALEQLVIAPCSIGEAR